MIDAGVGRLLVASLHQGIADLLPTRLEFYEAWLNPAGLRDGRIGLAPLAAVLSFLRQEGEPYQLVAARAGEYTAEWLVADLPRFERTIVRAAPAGVARPPRDAAGARDGAQHLRRQPRDRPLAEGQRQRWTSAGRSSARSGIASRRRCASSTRRPSGACSCCSASTPRWAWSSAARQEQGSASWSILVRPAGASA